MSETQLFQLIRSLPKPDSMAHYSFEYRYNSIDILNCIKWPKQRKGSHINKQAIDFKIKLYRTQYRIIVERNRDTKDGQVKRFLIELYNGVLVQNGYEIKESK